MKERMTIKKMFNKVMDIVHTPPSKLSKGEYMIGVAIGFVLAYIGSTAISKMTKGNLFTR